MRKRLLCVALLLVCFGLQSRVDALTSWEQSAFQANLQFIIDHKPHYGWGGSGDDLTKGLDCSGYVFRAAKWSGLFMRRTTALRMSMGEGGWEHDEIVNPVDSFPLDIVWWTFKVSRPNGHVGVIWMDSEKPFLGSFFYDWIGKEILVTHASASRNQVVVDRYSPYLIDKTTRIGRLK